MRSPRHRHGDTRQRHTDDLNEVYVFDPAIQAWTNVTLAVRGPPPPPRNQFGCAHIDGLIYIFGGMAGTCEASKFGL